MNDPDILNFGNTALMKIAARGTAADIGRALSRKLDVNQTNDNGQTALLYAAYYNNEAGIVSLLLTAGADVHHQDRHGYTALNFAALSGNLDAVRSLLKSGADPNHRCGHGPTHSLMFAAEFGYTDIARELLQVGVDPKTVTDVSCRTALDYARSNNDSEMIDLLLEYWPQKN